MEPASDLFSLSRNIKPILTMAGSSIPVLLIDNVYERADEIREMALKLTYSSPPDPYPGKIAIPPASKSLGTVIEWALRIADQEYLRRIPPITHDGRPVSAFQHVYTDFAIVDVHPDELSPAQRLPHVDPVPIFGLIYLNREERGGTLFFDIGIATGEPPKAGYFTSSTAEFQLCGRVEAAFNRMVIYPGFVPHSGEIVGDWIEGERRFTSPRLTQRFAFWP